MNGLIPLGIPESALVQFITTGLSIPVTPPPPDNPSISGGGLSLEEPKVIVNNADTPFTSAGFAIPSMGTRITWQVIGEGTVALQGSLDAIHFNDIDTTTSSGVRTIQAGPTSLRAVVSAGFGITVIVTVKREKL